MKAAKTAKAAAPPKMTTMKAMKAKQKTTTSATEATNSMKAMPKKINLDASTDGAKDGLKQREREYWHWEDTRDITSVWTSLVYKGDLNLRNVQCYNMERAR